MGLIGYARVSTAEGRQVLDRQLDALNDAGDFAFDEAFQVSHNFACCRHVLTSIKGSEMEDPMDYRTVSLVHSAGSGYVIKLATSERYIIGSKRRGVLPNYYRVEEKSRKEQGQGHNKPNFCCLLLRIRAKQ